MTKIFFNITCLEQGGAERVVSNLANRFVKDGYDIVIATQWYGENEFVLDKRIKRIHVGLKDDVSINRFRNAVRRIANLRKTIKQEKPDIVLSFLKGNNYRTLLATLGLSVPKIVAVRIDPKSEYNTKADKLLIPLLYPMADGAVFQTEEQKEFFPKSIQKRAEVILNPVHDKYLKAVCLLDEKEKCVIQTGRLVSFKNQELLIRAFIKVHERHPDYQLKFYGRDAHDGTKEKLEALIKEKAASDYIELMGACDELEKVIPKAEIFASSSDYEGLPNALIEAMVLGMPVVATDCPCGGPATLITHEKNGLLIPVNDEDAMTESICRLIEDKELAKKLGVNAAMLSERVNEEAIIAQWKNYIERVIKGKK